MIPEEVEITSASGDLSRNAWHLPGDSSARKIGVFLDGELYVKRMEAHAILLDLQQRGEIPPMHLLFISHLNWEVRHHDFTCNARYAEFIATDVVRWMRERHPLAEAEGHFIGGTSLSALQAAFISISYPKLFASVLCHSGSFWWNHEWLTRHVTELPHENNRLWLSVGNKEQGAGACHPPTGLKQEVDQTVAVNAFAEALGRMGRTVHHHVYNGGHDTNSWKRELPDAMRWLLGASD